MKTLTLNFFLLFAFNAAFSQTSTIPKEAQPIIKSINTTCTSINTSITTYEEKDILNPDKKNKGAVLHTYLYIDKKNNQVKKVIEAYVNEAEAKKQAQYIDYLQAGNADTTSLDNSEAIVYQEVGEYYFNNNELIKAISDNKEVYFNINKLVFTNAPKANYPTIEKMVLLAAYDKWLLRWKSK